MFEYSTILYSAVVDSHMGFYVVVMMVAICCAIYYDEPPYQEIPVNRGKFGGYVLMVMGISLLSYVGYQSFSNDISVECADKQETVVAYLSNTFTTAVSNEKDHPKVFGQYMYMDDVILVEQTGKELPERQNFYRIDVKKYPQCSKK